MSFPFVYLYPLNCADECAFDDWRLNGKNAELVIRLFQWAGQAVSPSPIGVEPGGAPRLANALEQARPNPANPSATIRYSVARAGEVRLRIFDVSGRLVRTLVEETQAPKAEGFEVVWDGRNDGGQRVSSGVYFYDLSAPGYSASRRLVVLK